MHFVSFPQNRVTADLDIPKIGKYVLVIQYYHPSDNKVKMNVYLRYPQGTQRGEFNLQSCNYRFGCRQVAVDNTGAVKVFDVSVLQRMVVTLLARDSSSPIAVVMHTCINIRKQYNQLKIRLGILLLTSFVLHNLYSTHQIKLPKVHVEITPLRWYI